MKCCQAIPSLLLGFPMTGRSAAHREKQTSLTAQVRASGKNDCRKLLGPLLPIALYFFPFKEQRLFLCFWIFFFLFFFDVWLGFILWQEGPWSRRKNRLHLQLAQGDSNQSPVSPSGKASLRCPRKSPQWWEGQRGRGASCQARHQATTETWGVELLLRRQLCCH